LKDRNYYIINGITLYRLLAAPVLVILVFTANIKLFGWLLAVSFFTDMIDGFLARKFKVTSIFGSRLDSIGDDLTILAGLVGLFALKRDFVKENTVIIVILVVLLVTQNLVALIKYGKLSSFHTYLAKIAAIVQGSFLILLFLLPQPLYWLFYAAAVTSFLDLVEEIIMVMKIKEWKADVKGLFWMNSRES
jgi:phosphatidylglycerophosphate synthase